MYGVRQGLQRDLEPTSTHENHPQGDSGSTGCGLKRKLVSLSHGQEFGQLADLATDWLFILVQPMRSQLIFDLNLDNDYNS